MKEDLYNSRITDRKTLSLEVLICMVELLSVIGNQPFFVNEASALAGVFQPWMLAPLEPNHVIFLSVTFLVSLFICVFLLLLS